jgi:selenide, water dikinase
VLCNSPLTEFDGWCSRRDMNSQTNQIRLTQTVQKGGCAAKVAASELRRILQGLKFPEPHAELLVDGRHFDDAAIYKVTPELAMVQTIDFFTPIVDSPDLFGKIAACNALSDVYAMGGRPRTALGVLAFPLATMGLDVISAVMQGAADIIGSAKANLVGGHSIDDDTLKFGLSVTGFVHPDRVWSNQGARAGDALILTKPLGTGTLTAALKRGAVNEDDLTEATESMTRLNNVMDYLPEDLLTAIHAATDITGFGLSGHAWQMAKASQVGMNFSFSSLPLFELAPMFLQKEFLTKAHRTNREYTSENLSSESLPAWSQALLHDPQTSGGLLLSVDRENAMAIVDALSPHFPGVVVVGDVTPSAPFLKFS